MPNEKSRKNRPSNNDKTKIDKRFSAMFTDKSFKINYGKDKFGRPMEHVSSENLEKYYDLSDSESEASDKEEEIKEETALTNEISEEDKESESEEEESETSTDEDDDSSDEENENEFDHKWEELDAEVSEAKEVTKRLAVCNMDWDRIRAEDILAVCNSFKPSEGIVHSVKIYPSEFGLQRMEEEKLHGPRELVEQPLQDGEEDEVKKNPSGEGSKYHREKLRQYQINRLKYYYAVVECDSPRTSDAIYEQLNGMEYESSSVSFDLRFIPDDVTFDVEPKQVAQGISDPSEYKPRLFINTALQQVKVNLTWDETDPRRRETLQKAFQEPESLEKDIKSYLASSSESESEDETHVGKDKKTLKMKDRISKYRSLLQSLEDKEKEEENKYEMEITWNPDLDEHAKDRVKEKLQQKSSNPFEEKLLKKKEEAKMKKKEKKLQLQQKDKELSSSGDEEDIDESDSDLSEDGKNVSVKKIDKKKKMGDELALLMGDSRKVDPSEDDQQSRKKKKKEKKVSELDSVQIDVDDPRFSALYTSHLYNIDPSNPQYKETKNMKEFMQKKQKRRQQQQETPDKYHGPPSKHSKLSLDSRELVESVKRKANFKRSNR